MKKEAGNELSMTFSAPLLNVGRRLRCSALRNPNIEWFVYMSREKDPKTCSVDRGLRSELSGTTPVSRSDGATQVSKTSDYLPGSLRTACSGFRHSTITIVKAPKEDESDRTLSWASGPIEYAYYWTDELYYFMCLLYVQIM